MAEPFHIQGHRGARGERRENTLPSFEAAWDALCESVETDLHLTADGVPVLCHDPLVTPLLFRRPRGNVTPALVRKLTLEELREFVADQNRSKELFPAQMAEETPLGTRFASQRRLPSAYCVPTLDDLFAFAAAYAADPDKSMAQR